VAANLFCRRKRINWEPDSRNPSRNPLTGVVRIPILKRPPLDAVSDMRDQKAIVATVALGVLLASTGAWGCPNADGQSCTMADCPMAEERPGNDCHDGMQMDESPMAGATIQSCEASSPLWIGCCDSPTSDDPARLETTDFQVGDAQDSGAPVGRIEPPSPTAPPRFAADLLSARDHDVGRYTLLSTFLL
jgi:hypothetical protein